MASPRFAPTTQMWLRHQAQLQLHSMRNFVDVKDRLIGALKEDVVVAAKASAST